ncbi:hypothetical protein JTE90_024618 [Oedothorax gibbosus]|uniref:Uncharacterized protein n=1 Tax=Oedothorax gibbosus TaxID=931172 RepID=A0AAV6UFK4_9ARAC|nr:hypothetical protein JTE90_024618 [Oedothorax gibbosus]
MALASGVLILIILGIDIYQNCLRNYPCSTKSLASPISLMSAGTLEFIVDLAFMGCCGAAAIIATYKRKVDTEKFMKRKNLINQNSVQEYSPASQQQREEASMGLEDSEESQKSKNGKIESEYYVVGQMIKPRMCKSPEMEN